jgi:two-component system, NarL family, sensor kinase
VQHDGRVRIVLPYLVTALVSVLVVAIASSTVGNAIAQAEAVHAAADTAADAAHRMVEPVLTPGLLTGDPAALTAVDKAVREHVLGNGTIRVKIWDRDGRIVWSDESRLIGERFTLEEDERAAFDGTAPDAALSDLTRPENRYEEPQVQLLEVYQPVHLPGGVPLLFEAYFRYSGVEAAAQRIWRSFLPVALGAVVILELLQLPIAAMLARRLRRAQAQREAALRRTLSAVEDERRRIASDLHDGVVQDLAGAAFFLGAAGRAARTGPVEADVLEDVAQQVRDSVRALRSLLVDIYPPNIYDGGLATALPDLVDRLVPEPVRTRVELPRAMPPLPATTVELVYRVAQEGLRNAVRHANARTVRLELHLEPDLLVLVVADDGRGLDPAGSQTRPGHLGLRTLAGMAADRGARLLVESAPGAGTTLRLEAPR